MRSVLRLANQMSVSIGVGAFAVAFWVSIRHQSFEIGLYPRLVIIALLIVTTPGLIIAARQWRRGELEEVEDDDLPPPEERYASEGSRGNVLADVWRTWHRTIITAIALLVFLWLMPRLGFYESALLFHLTLFFALGIRRVAVLLALTSSVMVLHYWLFSHLLNVRFPSGLVLG